MIGKDRFDKLFTESDERLGLLYTGSAMVFSLIYVLYRVEFAGFMVAGWSMSAAAEFLPKKRDNIRAGLRVLAVLTFVAILFTL